MRTTLGQQVSFWKFHTETFVPAKMFHFVRTIAPFTGSQQRKNSRIIEILKWINRMVPTLAALKISWTVWNALLLRKKSQITDIWNRRHGAKIKKEIIVARFQSPHNMCCCYVSFYFFLLLSGKCAHLFYRFFFVYLYPFFVCNRMPDGSVTKLLFILGFFFSLDLHSASCICFIWFEFLRFCFVFATICTVHALTLKCLCTHIRILCLNLSKCAMIKLFSPVQSVLCRFDLPDTRIRRFFFLSLLFSHN